MFLRAGSPCFYLFRWKKRQECFSHTLLSPPSPHPVLLDTIDIQHNWPWSAFPAPSLRSLSSCNQSVNLTGTLASCGCLVLLSSRTTRPLREPDKSSAAVQFHIFVNAYVHLRRLRRKCRGTQLPLPDGRRSGLDSSKERTVFQVCR